MPYAPATWLPNPNLMTLYAAVVRLPPRLPIRRERWELPDGDFLDLNLLDGPAGAPLVLVLHGLEGSSRRGYVLGLAAAARAHGFGCAALNFRGCSGELNRLPRFYHSGETGDLEQVVGALRKEAPGRALGIVGVSLGGNVVSKWLAEQGDAVPAEVRGAVAISPPYDLAACAQALDGPGAWAKGYRDYFLRSLRRKSLAKAQRFPSEVDAKGAAAATTLRAFDDAVTAPLGGFANAEVYWARSSAGPLLGAVRRPLHVIASRDDPFMPPPSFVGSASVTSEIYDRGGHIAFVEGTPWNARRYAELRAIDWLAERLG